MLVDTQGGLTHVFTIKTNCESLKLSWPLLTPQNPQRQWGKMYQLHVQFSSISPADSGYHLHTMSWSNHDDWFRDLNSLGQQTTLRDRRVTVAVTTRRHLRGMVVKCVSQLGGLENDATTRDLIWSNHQTWDLTTWTTNSLDLKPQHEDFAFKPSMAKYGNVNKAWQHKFPILAQEIPLHMDMFHSHIRRSENEKLAVWGGIR